MTNIGNRHRIKSMLFDVVFDDEKRSQELYDQIRSIHYNSLEKVISRCIDEVLPANKLTKLSKLELDLGVIEYNELEGELMDRTITQLKKKLKDILYGYEKEEFVSSNRTFSNLDILTHYLKKGYIPWNTDENINNIVNALLVEDVKAFVKKLRELGMQENIRERLAYRFNSSVHLKIVSALEPTVGRNIVQIHTDLVRYLSAWVILDKAKSELSSVLWMFIYNYLLTRNSSSFNVTEFIKNVLVQLANQYNLAFPVIIVSLTNAMKGADKGLQESLLTSLNQISKNYKIDIKKEQFGFRNFDRLSQDKRIDVLIEYLSTGTINPPVIGISQRNFDETFLIALQEVPGRIVETLKALGNSSVTVSDIVDEFDLKVIYRVIQVIAPGYHYSIINFEKGFVAIHKKDQLVQSSEKELSHTVLEFILKALLYAKGTYFNQKAFLKNLIEKTAAHYNLAYQAFFDKMYESARSISSKSVRFHIFFQLISEIKEEDFSKGAMQSNFSLEDFDEALNFDQEEAFVYLLNNDFSLLNDNALTALQTLRGYWQKYPMRAKRILSKYLAQEANRQKLARVLDHTAFLEFIQLYHRRNVVYFDQLFGRFKEAGKYLKKIIPSAKNYEILLVELFIEQAVTISEGWNFDEDHMIENVATGVAAMYRVDASVIIKALPPIELDVNHFGGIQEAAPFYSIIPEIIRRIVHHSSTIQKGELQGWGFENISDAVRHLAYYKRSMMVREMKKGAERELVYLVQRIEPTPVELLLSGLTTTNAKKTKKILEILKKRMVKIGYHKTTDLMNELTSVSLVFLFKYENGRLDVLIDRLEKVFNKFSLPPDLFDFVDVEWGDNRIAQDIDRLERSLRRELVVEQRKVSRAKVALEELFKEVQNVGSSTPYSFGEKKVEVMEELYIQNAGLVILQAYFPYFFEQCKLFDKGKFSSNATAKRGALLLQYVFNEMTDVNEEELILNKLLCGLLPEDMLVGTISPTKSELAIITQMFDAIISHWSIISNSTHQGFRESWLTRDGKLIKKEKSWELIVEQKAYDILLNQVPFSLTPIRYSWMDTPIHVVWG